METNETKKQVLIDRIINQLKGNAQADIDQLTEAIILVASNEPSESAIVLFQRLYYVLKDVRELEQLNEIE